MLRSPMHLVVVVPTPVELPIPYPEQAKVWADLAMVQVLGKELAKAWGQMPAEILRSPILQVMVVEVAPTPADPPPPLLEPVKEQVGPEMAMAQAKEPAKV